MNSPFVNLIEVSEEEETGSSLPRRVVSLLMLALAGYCFWQGSGLFVWEDSARTIAAVASQTESSVVPDAVPITQIDVGDWVFAARNPSSSDDEGSSVSAEVDSSTWRLMVLKAYKPNGQPMEVRMLRPLVWLQQQNAQPGKNIYIASEELGFFGDMLVKEIHACPQLMPRPGPGYEVVTATFRHRRADVIDLSVQDVAQPIGTTPNHPFWSEDRQTFTPAGDLFVGEKLRLANGNLTYLTKTTPRPGTHWVYNLEVNTQHVYHVSDAGLLVHNSNACGGLIRHPFADGGTHLTTTQRQNDFKRLGSTTYGNPKSGLFLAPKSQINDLLTSGASRREIEIALGLDRGVLDGGKLLRIDVDDPFSRGLRLPSGGNIHRRPGTGLTTGNLYEGIIDAPKIGTRGVRKSIVRGL